jgi:hypothetical protein
MTTTKRIPKHIKPPPPPIKHKVRPTVGTVYHPACDLWQARVYLPSGRRVSLGYHVTRDLAAAAHYGAIKVLGALSAASASAMAPVVTLSAALMG